MRYGLLLVARGVAPYISIGDRPDTDYLATRTVTTMRDAVDAATERPPCLLTGHVSDKWVLGGPWAMGNGPLSLFLA